MATWANLVGLAGAIALLPPAIHAVRHGLAIHRLDEAKSVTASEELKRRVESREREVKELRDTWVPWKLWCVVLGALATVTSYAIALFEP